MKDPMRRIERFCYDHPRFGIPNLMRYIAIGSAVFWVLFQINGVLPMYLAFFPQRVLHGEIWRLVTFLFYPPDSGWLGLIAIYFYYWIGSTLEQYWGTPKFNIYFFSGVLLTILYGLIVTLITGYELYLTVDYVYLAMFFAFAVFFPDVTVMLFFILPIKIKYLAYVDAFFFLYAIVTGGFPMSLLPVIAILNFFVFCGGELLHRIRANRVSKGTINFRRESARLKREQRDRLYTHKCSVCGRTDVTNPELEFRYCSRCAGYHCFCQDHINNHIHFTE